MKQITIADSLFMPHTRSASVGQTNQDGPEAFEWVLGDAKTARFVTESHIREARGPGQVAWVLESFFMHPENFLYLLHKNFDAVLTTSQYFVDNTNWLWYPHGGSWIDESLWGMYEKDRAVSMLASPKSVMPGHKLRHKVSEMFGDRIDVFGIQSHIDPKTEALERYCFSVVIQSEKCPGFFDEKIIDCFAMGTIPIYWGDPNISYYFNPEGIIEVDSLGEIEYVLEVMDHKFYQSKIEAARENLEIARQYRVCEDWLFGAYPELFEVK